MVSCLEEALLDTVVVGSVGLESFGAEPVVVAADLVVGSGKALPAVIVSVMYY